jgi:hypothetical protein
LRVIYGYRRFRGNKNGLIAKKNTNGENNSYKGVAFHRIYLTGSYPPSVAGEQRRIRHRAFFMPQKTP